jgi:hypothetical protein
MKLDAEMAAATVYFATCTNKRQREREREKGVRVYREMKGKDYLNADV